MNPPAERSQRLFAAILDASPLALVISLNTYALTHRSPFWKLLAPALFVALSAAQFWLLTTRGQSLGKMALRIRIVRGKDGRNGGFVTNVLLRVGSGALIGMIPYVGALYTFADLILIFREDRLCLHDMIAGTRVVKGAPAARGAPWRFRV